MHIESIRALAASVRGRRLALGLSQAELAARVGVSRQWVNGFEAGKRTAEVGLVLRLLDALDLGLDLFERSSHRDEAAGEGPDLDALLRDYDQR
jgi:transcriptional regulator with XRE-family HTH domain